MDVEPRPDLIPSSCRRCEADVTSGSHNGVGGFWVKHADMLGVALTGAEALQWLSAAHDAPAAPTAEAVTTASEGVEIEGALA